MSLDDKLFKVKFECDETSHLCADNEICKSCKSKICTVICPAHVYEWDEKENKLDINFENCLECGACRIACEKKALLWAYPKGSKGVKFKLG